jgi:hypothetical protein
VRCSLDQAVGIPRGDAEEVQLGGVLSEGLELGVIGDDAGDEGHGGVPDDVACAFAVDHRLERLLGGLLADEAHLMMELAGQRMSGEDDVVGRLIEPAARLALRIAHRPPVPPPRRAR